MAKHVIIQSADFHSGYAKRPALQGETGRNAS